MKDLINLDDDFKVKVIMLKGEKGDKGDNGDGADYEQLSNKPKINNIELNGNVLASDLGLASVGAVEQVDGRVTQLSQDVAEQIGQVNHNFATIESSFVAENAYSVGEYMVIYGQLYVATSAIEIGDTMDESTNIEVVSVGDKLTELENEVTTVDSKINNLDKSSVGGSGKYISAISQTDGLINATASNLSTTPTSGSSAPITSGAVYPIKTAVDNLGTKYSGTVVTNTVPSSASITINRLTSLPVGKYFVYANARFQAGSYSNYSRQIKMSFAGTEIARQQGVSNSLGIYAGNLFSYIDVTSTSQVLELSANHAEDSNVTMAVNELYAVRIK